jgi:DNA-binding NarL/FixJ family response regulator
MDVVNILVVDDHPMFRRGIIDILVNEEGLLVVGVAADGLQAIEKAKELAPDVILMDLNMPRCSGLDAIQALQVEMREVNILVLTVSESKSDLFAAMKFGAKGYILKNTEPDELVHAVLHVARGGVIVSPSMATNLLSEFKFKYITEGLLTESADKASTELNSRETQVLQMISEGASNKEIADCLCISEATVRTHLRHIMNKLHLANRTQAAAYALRKGLIQQKGEESQSH